MKGQGPTPVQVGPEKHCAVRVVSLLTRSLLGGLSYDGNRTAFH